MLLGNEFKAAADEIELILSEAEGEELVRAVFSELELIDGQSQGNFSSTISGINYLITIHR